MPRFVVQRHFRSEEDWLFGLMRQGAPQGAAGYRVNVAPGRIPTPRTAFHTGERE